MADRTYPFGMLYFCNDTASHGRENVMFNYATSDVSVESYDRLIPHQTRLIGTNENILSQKTFFLQIPAWHVRRDSPPATFMAGNRRYVPRCCVNRNYLNKLAFKSHPRANLQPAAKPGGEATCE